MSGRNVQLIPARSALGSLRAGAFRFALGLPVFGHWQSDADWLSWGSTPLGRRPPRELLGLRLGYRPGYQRMLFRWSLFLEGTYLLTRGFDHPLAAEINAGGLMISVAGAYAYKAYKRRSPSRGPLGTPAEVLPEIVRWVDRADYIRTLPDGVVYLGEQLVNGRLEPLTHSINGDTPHWGITMSTGRGKSELYRSILPQLIAQGADADVIDMKKLSLHEFDGQPGVRIFREIDEVPAVIGNFKDEMEARYDELVKLPKSEHAAKLATYKRRVLTFEEMNAFSIFSKIKWRNEKASGDPMTEPWVQDLIICAAMARQVKMHILMAGQRLSAQAMGDSSGNFREMVSAWTLSNPTKQMWRMAGGTGTPPTSDVRGRHILKRGDSVIVYQGGYAETDEEVLSFMTTRRDGGADVLGQPGRGTRKNTEDVLGQPRTLVTVSEMAAQLGIKVEAARKRAQRGEFGPAVAADPRGAHLYNAPPFDAREVVADAD